MRKFARLSLIFLAVFVNNLIVSCTGSSAVNTEIHIAYLIDSTTAGIVASYYKGGGGMPMTMDEHPRDYSQHVIIYDIAAGTLADGGAICYQHPFGSVSVEKTESMLLIYNGIEKVIGTILRYSLQGAGQGNFASITLPSGSASPALRAISPDGRYRYGD